MGNLASSNLVSASFFFTLVGVDTRVLSTSCGQRTDHPTLPQLCDVLYSILKEPSPLSDGQNLWSSCRLAPPRPTPRHPVLIHIFPPLLPLPRNHGNNRVHFASTLSASIPVKSLAKSLSTFASLQYTQLSLSTSLIIPPTKSASMATTPFTVAYRRNWR
jgi:hypothetical protein